MSVVGSKKVQKIECVGGKLKKLKRNITIYE